MIHLHLSLTDKDERRTSYVGLFKVNQSQLRKDSSIPAELLGKFVAMVKETMPDFTSDSSEAQGATVGWRDAGFFDFDFYEDNGFKLFRDRYSFTSRLDGANSSNPSIPEALELKDDLKMYWVARVPTDTRLVLDFSR